jgi:hypothetical protein
VKGITAGSLSKRLIIVHKMGFLPGSLLIYKAGQTSGDYHREMNSTISRIGYLKW